MKNTFLTLFFCFAFIAIIPAVTKAQTAPEANDNAGG